MESGEWRVDSKKTQGGLEALAGDYTPATGCWTRGFSWRLYRCHRLKPLVLREFFYYPLSTIRYPLSVIHYPLSTIRYPLSTIH